MSDDKLAPGKRRIDLLETSGDELIGNAVEAVALDALGAQRPRDRQSPGDRRLVVMKRRVEAGHLRQMWADSGDRLDGREIMRLMQSRQRNESLQRAHERRCYARGPIEMCSSMDNPVAGTNQLGAAQMAVDPVEQLAEEVLMAEA